MIQKQPPCRAEDGHATVVVLYLSCVGSKNTIMLFSMQADLISIHHAATALRCNHYSDEIMCCIQHATRCDQYSHVIPVLRCNYKPCTVFRMQPDIISIQHVTTAWTQWPMCNVFGWNSRTLPWLGLPQLLACCTTITSHASTVLFMAMALLYNTDRHLLMISTGCMLNSDYGNHIWLHPEYCT